MVDRNFHDMFDDLNDLMDQIENEMEEMLHNFKKSGFPQGRPMMKGFALNFSPDGQPFFNTFGDSLVNQGPREPYIEQRLDKDELRVICELPGIEKEQVAVEVTEESMDLKAETPDRSYHANFMLKEPVEAASSKATCKNGILEVRFKLKRNANKEYRPIKVD